MVGSEMVVGVVGEWAILTLSATRFVAGFNLRHELRQIGEREPTPRLQWFPRLTFDNDFKFFSGDFARR